MQARLPEHQQATTTNGRGLRVKSHWVGTGLEGFAAVSGLALSAIACCTWALIQWLALVLSAVGGAAAFTVLARAEALLLVIAAGALGVAARFTRDPLSRTLDLALASLMLLLAALREMWSISPFLLWALGPLNWLFVHRQQVLLVAILANLAIRIGSWAWRHNQGASSGCCSVQPTSLSRGVAEVALEEHDGLIV